MNGFQIECRCRVRGELGEMLHAMPRAARSRAVAVLLASVGEGVDPGGGDPDAGFVVLDLFGDTDDHASL